MKVIFLLDNNEYVEVAPEKLQIRQIQVGQSALGTEVTVPVRKEDGTVETNEDGTPKTQTGFRPFINYAVNLSVPAPADAAPATATPAAPEQPAPKAAKSKGKAKAAKRRVN
jgi:hypothetical protein